MRTLYVADLDGTLLGPDARVSEACVSLLRPLVERGLALTVATARSPATAVELTRPLGLHLPAVLMTGTLVYDLASCRALRTTHLTPRAADALCTLLEQSRQEAFAYCVKDGRLYVYYRHIDCAFEQRFMDERLGSPYKTFAQVESYAQALAGSETLMFLLCLPDIAQARAFYPLLAGVPDILSYYYYDDYGKGVVLEIYPAGCTKASGLEAVRRLTGAQRVISFGDNINDVPLFAASDESCAMANAAREAKEAATRVIGPNTADAAARWIAEHWEREASGHV